MARDKRATAGSRKRGTAAATAVAAALTATPADGHNRAKASPIVWPVKGPGRKRIVQPGSLDEVAARIAHDIAASAVDQIREAVEIMARDALARLIGKR